MEIKVLKKEDNIQSFEYENGIIYATVVINDNWVGNPTLQMLLDDGWEDITPPPHVRTLEEAINEKLDQITQYDTSSEVNEFYLNGISMWYDFTGRQKIALRVARDKEKGNETTLLGDDGFSIELPINVAENILNQIEDYATACYDVTNTHKSNVRQLTTINDVDNYDYRTGYPEKLRFTFNE